MNIYHRTLVMTVLLCCFTISSAAARSSREAKDEISNRRGYVKVWFSQSCPSSRAAKVAASRIKVAGAVSDAVLQSRGRFVTNDGTISFTKKQSRHGLTVKVKMYLGWVAVVESITSDQGALAASCVQNALYAVSDGQHRKSVSESTFNKALGKTPGNVTTDMQRHLRELIQSSKSADVGDLRYCCAWLKEAERQLDKAKRTPHAGGAVAWYKDHSTSAKKLRSWISGKASRIGNKIKHGVPDRRPN